MIAEFERLLAVHTSTEETFKQNFLQVSDAILGMAAKVRGRKPIVDKLLKLLDNDDPLDDMETDNTEGKLYAMKP